MEKDALGSLAANDERIDSGEVITELYGACRMVSKRQTTIVGRVVEDSIHAARHIERYVLVGAAVIDALTVLVLQVECLS